MCILITEIFNLVYKLTILTALFLSTGIYLVAAKRTAFGAYGGKLKDFTPTDLQEIACRAALQAGNINPEIIDSVCIGNIIHVSK